MENLETHFLQDLLRIEEKCLLGSDAGRMRGKSLTHCSGIPPALPSRKPVPAELCWHLSWQRSSRGAEVRMHACPCLRPRLMNTEEACRQPSPAGPDQRWGEPIWVRHQTACSVDKSSCRTLRNDSSLIPRWGVCLLLPSLSKERESGTCLSIFILFPCVTNPVTSRLA